MSQIEEKKCMAFDFPEVRVVEASAGSGKTYALAKRYVQLLLSCDVESRSIPIQNILALTFTNKASFEMKERILYFLKGIALNQLSETDLLNILQPIDLEIKEAQRKAFEIMDSIIHNYHFFQVQTIDKFINSLLSGCAFKVGLTASFKIKTTAFEYLEYSLDRLIDQAAYDADTFQLFDRFLDNYLYLENRKGWFPKSDIMAVVKALYDQNNVFGFDYERSPYTVKKINQQKRKVLELMRSLKECLPEKTNARFRKSLDKFLLDHEFGFDIDSVPNFSSEEPPLNKGAEDISNELYELWGNIQQCLKQLCIYEAYSLYNPYIEVFENVMSSFYAQSSKDDVLFLEELNKRARNLFDEQGITVEEIYFRLATRISHYLIDEFQDTSRLQWANLQMMPEEALSTGGSLFYVGDRKQAIYGFRGGDARLFGELKKDFGEFVKEEPLVNNYRSHKEIVQFNNQIFSVDNLNRFIQLKESKEKEKKVTAPVVFHGGDYRQMTNVFEASHQEHQSQYNKGYVQIEPIDEDLRDESNRVIQEKVIATINELTGRFELRDIAILTRNNNQIESVTNWLLENNIPVDSERTSNIKDNERIQELIYFLEFLSSPVENVAFARTILSEFFLKAADIKREEIQSFIFSQRQFMFKQKGFYLYLAFKKAYPDIWNKYFEEFFKNVGLYPLYELVISIYDRFDCVRHFYDDQGFWMLFLELIKKREEDHSDIASFLEYFEELKGEALYVQIAGLNAVKLTTIHKSKGLEFPVVIIPFLSMDIQIGSKSSESAQSYVLQQANDHLKLMRLKKTYYRYSEELYQIYRREYIDSLISELNNVYVALTRSSCELYVYVPKKSGQSFNIVRWLIPEDKYICGEKKSYELSKEVSKEVPFPIDTVQHQNWISYLNDDHLASQQTDTYANRVQGMIMHFLLSKILNLKEMSFDASIEQALVEAKAEFTLLESDVYYRNKIKTIVSHEKFTDYFNLTDAFVYTEKEIIDQYGHTKRIDRLIEKPNEVLVVDYKTSKDDKNRDIIQIKQYMKLLRPLYKQSIKGILIYLNEMTKEEVYE